MAAGRKRVAAEKCRILLWRNIFEKPTKAVFPDRVEGIRFLVGHVEMDVPHWYVRHLPLKFKNRD